MNQILIIEKLNYYLFFKYLLIFFIKKNDLKIYYYSKSVNLTFLSYLFPNYVKVTNKLKFSFLELKTNKEPNIFFETHLKYCFKVFPEILASLNFKSNLIDFDIDNFIIYLKKRICISDSQNYAFLNSLILIHIVNKFYNIPNNNSKIKIILENQRWGKQIKNYSKTMNISVDFHKNYLINLFIELKIRISSSFIYIFYFHLSKYLRKKFQSFNTNNNDKKFPIIIDDIIYFVNNSLIWNNDLINPSNSLFVNRTYFEEANKIVKNNKNSLNYFCLENSDFFNKISNFYLNKYLPWPFSKYEIDFLREKNLWKHTFKKFDSKIYVTTGRWEPHTIAATNAINEINGISIFYQTSYYEWLDGFSAIKSDIFFSFSNSIIHTENEGGSKFKYNIACGYAHDFKFELEKDQSFALREKLKSKGAKKIIAFFDHSYSDDERWYYNKECLIDQYIFFLEKLINNPWLGMVFKSKKPGNIFLTANNPYKLKNGFEKLEPILKKALSTGRCFFYTDRDNFSTKNSKDSVAKVAMASDLSIYNFLYAGTAALESALSGTPTLIYDDINLKKSEFYKLGKDKVVFDSYEFMWEKIDKYFAGNGVIGDWSELLPKIDPFRDGKAYFRISQFIYWLNEKYKITNDKDEVINYAINKYSDKWGSDKIIYNF